MHCFVVKLPKLSTHVATKLSVAHGVHACILIGAGFVLKPPMVIPEPVVPAASAPPPPPPPAMPKPKSPLPKPVTPEPIVAQPMGTVYAAPAPPRVSPKPTFPQVHKLVTCMKLQF